MNGMPFLSRLQTSLADFFRPEQSQNQPPEVSNFVPSSPNTPSILPTIRGILSSQGQPQIAQQSQQPQPQPQPQAQPTDQQMNPLDELMLLLQLLGQSQGGEQQ